MEPLLSSFHFIFFFQRSRNILALAIAKCFLTFPYMLVATTDSAALLPYRGPVFYLAYLNSALPIILLVLFDRNIRRAIKNLLECNTYTESGVWSVHSMEKGEGKGIAAPATRSRGSIDASSQVSIVRQWVDEIIMDDPSGPIPSIRSFNMAEWTSPPNQSRMSSREQMLPKNQSRISSREQMIKKNQSRISSREQMIQRNQNRILSPKLSAAEILKCAENLPSTYHRTFSSPYPVSAESAKWLYRYGNYPAFNLKRS